MEYEAHSHKNTSHTPANIFYLTPHLHAIDNATTQPALFFLNENDSENVGLAGWFLMSRINQPSTSKVLLYLCMQSWNSLLSGKFIFTTVRTKKWLLHKFIIFTKE